MNNANQVVTKNSLIHGTGVYANIPFRAGEIVISWDHTKEITKEEHSALPPEEQKYVDIQNGKILQIGAPERFVNHSCEPNTVPGHLCDIALRDIFEGEEITTDYQNVFILAGSFTCRCGSQRCRNVIFGKPTALTSSPVSDP